MATKQELKEFIFNELGYPQLQVELTDNQVFQVIDKTVKRFCNFAYDGEILQYIKMNCEGKGEYKISPDIAAITNISKGGLFFSQNLGGGWIDDSFTNLIHNGAGSAISFLVHISGIRSGLKKYFGDSINYEYNEHKRKLYIYENYVGPLIIEAYLKYKPDEDDMIYEHEWIQRMCVEQCRLLLSTILGKYNAPLVGGVTINYDSMKEQAQEEIQKLDEELMNRWVDIAPVMVV